MIDVRQYEGWRLHPALALQAEPYGLDASRFDPGRESCPHCSFIWEACDCDMPAYHGAFYTKGRTS